jgi:hypothetical protein
MSSHFVYTDPLSGASWPVASIGQQGLATDVELDTKADKSAFQALQQQVAAIPTSVTWMRRVMFVIRRDNETNTVVNYALHHISEAPISPASVISINLRRWISDRWEPLINSVNDAMPYGYGLFNSTNIFTLRSNLSSGLIFVDVEYAMTFVTGCPSFFSSNPVITSYPANTVGDANYISRPTPGYGPLNPNA